MALGKMGDPLHPEILRLAEEIEVRSKLLTEKAFLWEQLSVADTRREKYKIEIADDLDHIRREILSLRDFKDNLSTKANEILFLLEKDITAAAKYLDDDSPSYPFSSLVDNAKALYEEVLI